MFRRLSIVSIWRFGYFYYRLGRLREISRCVNRHPSLAISMISQHFFSGGTSASRRARNLCISFVNVEFDFVDIFVLITPLFFSRCRITSKRFWTNGTRSTTKSGPSSSSWNETDAWPKPMPAPFPSKSTAAMTDSTDFGTDFTLMPLPATW